MGEHARTNECGVFDIRINRDGLWFYHGSPIGRKELVRLFASVLKRDRNGRFFLETPAERGFIEVEDAPFLAVGLKVEGPNDNNGQAQTLIFSTNIDENVVADADHPLRVVVDPQTGEPNPYILVRDGLEARLTRPIYYELVELGVEAIMDGRTHIGVWSAGTFFDLGTLE